MEEKVIVVRSQKDGKLIEILQFATALCNFDIRWSDDPQGSHAAKTSSARKLLLYPWVYPAKENQHCKPILKRIISNGQIKMDDLKDHMRSWTT
jgi:hypothetical protein